MPSRFSASAIRIVLPLALVLSLVGAAAPAPGGPDGELVAAAAERFAGDWPAPALPGSVLVTAASPAAAAGLASRVESLRADVPGLGRVDALGGEVLRVRTNAGAEPAVAARIAELAGVRAVEPDWLLRPAAIPNDPWYDRQWAHKQTRAEQAWDVTTGSATVRVAVIDTGMWGVNPDLRPNLEQQVDFSTGVLAEPPRVGIDNDTCDDGHGSWVGGVVGAAGANALDVAGVAWRVSMIDIALKSTRPGARCDAMPFSAVVAGLNYAVDNALGPVDVVNLSLGGYLDACPTSFQSAANRARAAGVLIVASAGNGERDPATAGRYSYPASCDGVVSVGATSRLEGRAGYSTTNDRVDIAAPGGDGNVGGTDGLIATTTEDPAVAAVRRVQGTSFASPYVAGVAALMVARNALLTPAEAERILLSTAKDVGAPGRDVEFGAGIVQTDAAVAAALPAPVPAPSPSPTTSPSPSPSPAPAPAPAPTASPLPEAPRVAPPAPVTISPSPTPSPDQRSAENPPAPPSVARVSAPGSTTEAVPQAVAVSQQVFADGAAAHVVLARADDYADALAGSALAMGRGPVLFAGREASLPSATRTEIARVLPRDRPVYLLGGGAALPTSLEAELRSMGYQPVRLAGAAREETAAAVADEVVRRRAALDVPDPGAAILVTRGNWADAVAAGPLAAMLAVPIVLTPPDRLDPATEAALRRLDPAMLYVVGGQGVVSSATASAAGGAARAEVRRLAGPARDATAVAVGAEILHVLERAGVAQPRFVVAVNLRRADGYAHAISASAFPGSSAGVFVPVEEAGGTLLTADAERFIAERLGHDGLHGVVAGATDLIASGTQTRFRELLEQAWEAGA